MNRWTFFILLLLAGTAVKAQYSQEWVIGGRINYMNGGRVLMPDGERKKAGYTIKVAPSLAYFIRNDLAVGVGVGYEYTKDLRGRQHTGEIVPFIRYDFGGGQVRPFLRAETGWGWGRSYMKEGNDGKHFLWTSTLKPGVWIRITDRWAAEATFSSLQYKRVKATDLETDETITRDKWKFRWLDISFGFACIFRW